MAQELTPAEEKLGEVLGLAQAAQQATRKVGRLVRDETAKKELARMAEEAKSAEQSCKEIAAELEGRKTAVNKKARETKSEAGEMMSTYLGEDSDGLDGFEFLVMAEAGELSHWQILDRINRKARLPGLDGLIREQLEIQERHFATARETALKLAEREAEEHEKEA